MLAKLSRGNFPLPMQSRVWEAEKVVDYEKENALRQMPNEEEMSFKEESRNKTRFSCSLLLDEGYILLSYFLIKISRVN